MVRRGRREQSVYWGAFVLDWFKYLQEHDLTSSDYKILFFLCEKMEKSNNSVFYKQKQIAENLNMDKGNVSKCIKKLCEKQFIAKSPNGFVINPHLFYVAKRDSRDREELRENFDDLLIKNGITPRFALNEDEHKLEEPIHEISVEDNGRDIGTDIDEALKDILF